MGGQGESCVRDTCERAAERDKKVQEFFPPLQYIMKISLSAFDSALTVVLQPSFKVSLSIPNGCHVAALSGLLLKVSLA